MNAVLENIRFVLPFFAFFWLLTIAGTAIWPYKYRNSLFLMGALFFTLVLIGGLFGENIGTALLVIFLLCMLSLLLVPFMLMANGFVMLKKEGFALAHILSLALGIAILAGELAVVFNISATAFFEIPQHVSAIVFFVGSGVFYFSVLLLAFVLYMLLLEIMPHRRDFDYIIIHGCGLRTDGSVTKLLANRLDRAVSVYNKCRKTKPVLIPSGGQGADECRSEAAAMTEYLLAHGIPSENIIPEDKSATTRENLQYSKAIIDSRGGSRRTALISGNYHIYRCLSLARELGFKCSGIGAKVALYFWPSAVIREFAAFLSKKRTLTVVLIGFFFFSVWPSLILLAQG